MLKTQNNEQLQCRFCDVWNHKKTYNLVDEPIAQNSDFMALSSIGALVEGWILVIPKTHSCSMKDLYSTAAFNSFVKPLISEISNQFGPLIAFEHGANKFGSATACGTEHAHFHIVPFESLSNDLKSSDLNWVSCLASEIKDRVGISEYLFYTELNESVSDDVTGMLHVLDSPKSQFFRKLIASKLGKSEFFDYKIYPFLETAEKTQRALSGAVVL